MKEKKKEEIERTHERRKRGSDISFVSTRLRAEGRRAFVPPNGKSKKPFRLLIFGSIKFL